MLLGRGMTDTSLAPILSAAPPGHTAEDSLALLTRHWGLTGRLDRLTSERDLNWQVTAPEGRFVLKFANAAEDPAVTRFQNGALEHVAARDPALPVPRVIRSLTGAPDVTLPDGSLLRLLSWVDGVPMHLTASSPAQRRDLGAMAARLTRALEGFDHPAANHELQWDLKQAAGLRPLLPAIADAGLRARCGGWLDWFDRVRPRLDHLPWQVVHADLNPHNVLCAPGDPDRIAGVLDFGDMVRTPRICDLAVAAAYHVQPGAGLASLAEVTAGWAAILPLTPDEAALLPGLTALRMVTTLALTSHRAARWPDNAVYILRNFPSAEAGLLALPPAPDDLTQGPMP